jgi:hydroxyacylglutathione hydrolase
MEGLSMNFAQIYTPGIAQCSYVLGSGDKCVVVDPVRNVDQYIAQAKAFGMKIVAVLETHLHADFISGHMELAERAGAKIYAPKIGNCEFPHHALVDGEEFTIGSLHFKLIETPGHTPDCTIYLVTDLERGKEPVLAFTGDTLMVGDVGRPDLFPNREEELAEKLFHSLKRIKELPDHVEVYPAHGMGSLCGRALSAKLWSTIGIERCCNYALQHENLADFKKDLLTDMPAAPDHFARCSEINRKGPALLKDLPASRIFSVDELAGAIEGGFTVLDVRAYHSYAGAHIPGSYSISKYGNMATFAGWVIPPDAKIVLILEKDHDLEEIKKALYNVGQDHIAGYLEGSIEAWVNAGREVGSIETISIHRLREWLENDPPLVLDNRAKNEWKKGAIPGTTLAPAPDVRHRYSEWNSNEPVVVLCNTSNRSMTAASLLEQRGFKRVINVLGGSNAWSAAGFPMSEGGDEA